jgi:hypothetical protein
MRREAREGVRGGATPNRGIRIRGKAYTNFVLCSPPLLSPLKIKFLEQVIKS